MAAGGPPLEFPGEFGFGIQESKRIHREISRAGSQIFLEMPGGGSPATISIRIPRVISWEVLRIALGIWTLPAPPVFSVRRALVNHQRGAFR